jgi:hypothetical protein
MMGRAFPSQVHEQPSELRGPVNNERELIEKLLRIEALFARPGTDGEKAAAASAAERIRARLAEMGGVDPPIEFQFKLADRWSRTLLTALLRRYGLRPYRYRRQRYTTVMARVSRRFVNETLWPEFEELNRTLQAYLAEVTDRVVAEAICPDNKDEEVRPDPVSGGGEIGPRLLSGEDGDRG